MRHGKTIFLTEALPNFYLAGRVLNFRESPEGEVRRILLPRTPVNKGAGHKVEPVANLTQMGDVRIGTMPYSVLVVEAPAVGRRSLFL